MQSTTTQTLSGLPPSESEAAVGREWPMHARGVGRMLDLAVDLFVARCVPVVGITFLMWLPMRVLLAATLDSEEDYDGVRTFSVFLGSFAVQTLSVALVIQVVYAELQGRPLELRRIARIALKRSPALLVSTTLIAIACSLGFLCVVVPGLFLTYIWSVAPAALVLEGRGPIACLARSQRLVSRRFLQWAGLMLCIVALKLPYDAAISGLDQPNAAAWVLEHLGMPAEAFFVARIVLSSLLAAVSSAAWSIAVTVFYLDCRVRREGFDLTMRLERLQDAARAARAP